MTKEVVSTDHAFDVLLAEYESLRGEIAGTFDRRRQIISFSVLVAGAIIPLLVGYGEGVILRKAFYYILLFTPIVFIGVALSYSGQVIAASTVSDYIHMRLRPQAIQLLEHAQPSIPLLPGFFSWEAFAREESQPRIFGKIVRSTTGLGDILILFAPVLGCISGFYFINPYPVHSGIFTNFFFLDIFLAIAALIVVIASGSSWFRKAIKQKGPTKEDEKSIESASGDTE